ncbi:MAG: hypothetical protein LBS76_00735 [Mycoplasmataceae bacterium]|nr:hypothetical protein [Mycoplasmataceae bacterium]
MRNIGYLTSKHNKKSDEAYTPKYAVKPILEFVPKNWIIWCPFDTEKSAFVKMLAKHGNKVIFTHKDSGQDFFQERERERESTIA